jgi:hypothetical protein
MSAFENAEKFFHACETPLPWESCKPYVADGATFRAQCEPLVGIDTIEGYCAWMKGVVDNACPGASYDLQTSSYDEKTRTAMFFGTYHLKHTKDGGPVPPTNNEAHADYVYIFKMNADGLVESMTKVWNAPWTLNELGWV